MQTGSESALPESLLWETLLEYEKVDVIVSVLRVVSGQFFSRDTLQVIEREETSCSSEHERSSVSSLLLFGRVSCIRQEAFLALVRSLRLRHVRDLCTAVSTSFVVGDSVPHMLLEPLVSSSHTASYRRWYRARFAISCGLIRRLQERQETARNRLRQLLGHGNVDEGHGTPAPGRSASPTLAPIASAQDGLLDLVSEFSVNGKPLGKAERARRAARFEAATQETRVDMAAVAATVPTLFIAWSYQHDCLPWMRTHLFNDSAVQQLNNEKGGVSEKLSAAFDVDPWMRFVEQRITVLPRRMPNEALQRKTVLPITAKRAQLVLVNVDREREKAASAFHELLLKCGEWRSKEVSLLSLWAGDEGLQSRFCASFGIEDFPFLVATSAAKRDYTTHTLTRPRITSIKSTALEAPTTFSDSQLKTPSPALPASRSALTRAARLDSYGDGHDWHCLSKEAREAVSAKMSAHLSKTGSLLRFAARSDSVYRLVNPFSTVLSKAIRKESLSSVRLTGLFSDQDVPLFKEELTKLMHVSNFEFSAQVICSSGPVSIMLDPATPTRIVRNMERSVTCSACAAAIDLDTAPHFRCIHCSSQQEGILCNSCAASLRKLPDMQELTAPASARARRADRPHAGEGARMSGALHASHHLFLRIPPMSGVTALSLADCVRLCTVPLLWGESNVTPLPLFCGQLIVSTAGVHWGVYCSRCKSMVKGVRWKCAVCCDYDVCQRCFDTVNNARQTPCCTPAEKTANVASDAFRVHLQSHPMLCIPHGLDGDNNCFLKPNVVSDLAVLTA